MVAVRVTEMYDLSTQVGKVGMVAIHTPGLSAASKLWGGLFSNYRFFRVASCDVALACASTLPADPLQIGEEAGTIAPQDMMNPILYKAVSNESFNRVLNRMYALNGVPSMDGNTLGSISEGDVLDANATVDDNFKFYYGLLADKDGWKKALPQQGLGMKGLYPIVYSVVNTYGNMLQTKNYPGVSNLDDVPVVGGDGTVTHDTDGAVTFRGPSMRMPRLPTKAIIPNYSQASNGTIPLTYVACIVLPPAKLNKFYYRMRVTWTLEFEELRPITDYDQDTNIKGLGALSYGSDYAIQSRTMTTTTNAVDGNGVAIEKIMTAGK